MGWSIDASQTAALVTNSLSMVIGNRNLDGTIIHSDRGTQLTSWAFTQRARESSLLPSMGSVGDCYDKRRHRGVWAGMQVELLDRKRWNPERFRTTASPPAVRVFACCRVGGDLGDGNGVAVGCRSHTLPPGAQRSP